MSIHDTKLHESIATQFGVFYLTVPYLKGAWDAQQGPTYKNPYDPGPKMAQYRYGFSNERQGLHDAVDLPFESKLPPLMRV